MKIDWKLEEKVMGYRGMHVVDADAHYLEEIRDFAKYLKGPAAERFADWSGQYHMPALVGDQYDVMLHGRTVRGAEAGKGDQDEMLGMSSPADLPFLSDAGRRKIMGENALGVFRFTEQTVNLEVSA